jgi:putative colanic acid biosynthesis acetyltransferase WcaF
MNEIVDISAYKRASTRKEQFGRFVWNIVWTIFARPLPRSALNRWKLFLLRLFGAKVEATTIVYSSAKIYQPWNLEIGAYSCIGPYVNIENSDKIKICSHVTISQKASIYTASHDINTIDFKWFSAPVIIENYAWIAAESFVMMGVTIGEGAVVGARAAVFKDVEPWTVVGGNPAKFIKKREIKG